MLDGTIEIGEENSLGLKSLKDSLYLKAATKVDFENWWKELSTFVPSPMKRAYSMSNILFLYTRFLLTIFLQTNKMPGGDFC